MLNNIIKSYIFSPLSSLPDEISKIQYDEDEVRQEISNAIDNLYGYNSVLNIPFKAFETLVKKQIDDLVAPIKKCISLVVKELKNAVQSCTGRVRTIHLTCNLYFRDQKSLSIFFMELSRFRAIRNFAIISKTKLWNSSTIMWTQI